MPNNPHAAARLLLLDQHAVEPLLQPHDVAQAVREAFILHSQRARRVFPVVREALTTGGVFGIKSGDVPEQGLLGSKAAGFWPANRAGGGEPHQATIVLIDPATGRPLCIIDGNAITTARTGAAGALGLKQLARPDSRRICVLGTGVQARVQLACAQAVLPLAREVVYVTASGAPDAAFEAQFSTCRMTHTVDRNEAVAGADVVITATPGRAVLFDLATVRPGTHFNCVGADTQGKRELPDGLLARARLFVDDREQARQIGEGQWAPDTPGTEVGDLVTGAASIARAPGDITLFDMTGPTLQDLTVARSVHRQALANGSGNSVAWPW